MHLRRLLAALMLLAAPPALAQDANTLNVYNWTDYIDPAALEAFKKQTGAELHYDVYDSLETLEGKMLAGHSGYDIIVPTSEPTFSRLIAAGALQPLDKAKLPALAGEDPALLKRVATSDPGNKFGAIYLWGTIGLGEIPSKIKALFADAPLDSWDLLFKPENAKQLAGCGITMMDSATDVIPSVLKYLHRDPASTDPKDLEAVEKTLMAHPAVHPHLRQWWCGRVAGGGADLPGDVLLRRRHPSRRTARPKPSRSQWSMWRRRSSRSSGSTCWPSRRTRHIPRWPCVSSTSCCSRT